MRIRNTALAALAVLSGSIIIAAVGLTPAPAPSPDAAATTIDGRWTFAYDMEAFDRRAPSSSTPAASPATCVTLELQVKPGNTLTGTVSGATGTRRAPGGAPPQAVEISAGTIDGDRVSFSAWRFDGYHNMSHYAGTRTGDTLDLTLTRDSNDGPVAWHVIARRSDAGCVALPGAGAAAAAPAVRPASQPAATGPRPNVIYLVLDDVGFSDLGSYGSEIATPNIDALAAAGLRYNNFHTRAICSPTRAALLTGRNSHAVGMKDLAIRDEGAANARGRITPAAATVAQLLQANGYSTYGVGKWHLTPMSDMTPAAPRTNWPLQKGFDRFYGFLSGWTDQFHPALIVDNHASVTPNRPGYHFSEAIVDAAINDVREGLTADGSSRPFFLYVAFGAGHAPIQAPASYIKKYADTYRQGWDAIRAQRFERQKQLGILPADTVMPPRNAGDKAWTDLTPDEQQVYARYMATYAGFLEHTDVQIGRLVSFLKDAHLFDNTLIVLISDNGAAPEAGPEGNFTSPYGGRLSIRDSLARLDDLGSDRSEALYQRAWAMAGDTPFRMYKLSMYEGGLRDPLIVTWPKAIPRGGAIRPQFIDVVDLTPTVLDIAGVTPPPTFAGEPQMPMHGKSLRATLTDAAAPDPRRTQVFELRGNRAIRQDGWKAVAVHVTGTPFDQDRWELYDIAHDPAEAVDLAAKYPDRLKSLQDLWWQEAREYGVLPLSEWPRSSMASGGAGSGAR